MRHFVAAGLLGSLLLISAAAGSGRRRSRPRAQTLATGVCAACHGTDGNSLHPDQPEPRWATPRLPLQATARLQVRRTQECHHGRDGSHAVGRGHAQSGCVLRRAETAARCCARRGGWPTPARRCTGPGMPAAGCLPVPVATPPTASEFRSQFPRLKGQHLDYTLAQLKAFRAGERDNDPSSMMRTIAGRMSDQDMQAVAEYILRRSA